MLKGGQLRQTWGATQGRTVAKACYGTIWPNGNFSVGVGPVGEMAGELEGAEVDNPAGFGDVEAQRRAIAALTSSNGPNSHTEESCPVQRGLHGITGQGQQMLRSGCYLLERDYGKADLCFATLTVPTLSKPGRVKLAKNWPELVRQFVQMVQRKLARAGRPTKVVGCVEIQTARLESRGEAYLHLHAVWPSHSNKHGEVWAVKWADLRNWWERALERFSGEKLPHHPRVEVAPVKKSAERYMGKYLSKGSGEVLEQFIEDLGIDSVPPSWWFMSATIRNQIKGEKSNGRNTGTMLDSLIQAAFEDGDLSAFEWIRHVEVEMSGRLVTIGWCGRLRPDVRDDVLGMLAPLSAGV
jgi:hypothetical protein